MNDIPSQLMAIEDEIRRLEGQASRGFKCGGLNRVKKYGDGGEVSDEVSGGVNPDGSLNLGTSNDPNLINYFNGIITTDPTLSDNPPTSDEIADYFNNTETGSALTDYIKKQAAAKDVSVTEWLKANPWAGDIAKTLFNTGVGGLALLSNQDAAAALEKLKKGPTAAINTAGNTFLHYYDKATDAPLKGELGMADARRFEGKMLAHTGMAAPFLQAIANRQPGFSPDIADQYGTAGRHAIDAAWGAAKHARDAYLNKGRNNEQALHDIMKSIYGAADKEFGDKSVRPGMYAAAPASTNTSPAVQFIAGKEDDNMAPIQAARGGMPVRPTRSPLASVSRFIRGGSKGQDDKVLARLSPGEFVVDADVVSALGDGNPEAGARELEKLRKAVRKHKRSAPAKSIPPKAKSVLAYMKKGK